MAASGMETATNARYYALDKNGQQRYDETYASRSYLRSVRKASVSKRMHPERAA